MLVSLYGCSERHKMPNFWNNLTERRGPNLGLHVHPTQSKIFLVGKWLEEVSEARLYSETTSPQQLPSILQRNVNSCATRQWHVGLHNS